jgi:hypothetical protein
VPRGTHLGVEAVGLAEPSAGLLRIAAALAERYPGLIAEDYAKMAGSFAPDREWGDLMERAMLRATETAANAEASA